MMCSLNIYEELSRTCTLWMSKKLFYKRMNYGRDTYININISSLLC